MNIAEAKSIINPKAATKTELKKAYRKMAVKYHPDRNQSGLDMMKLVNAAYDMLKSNMGLWSVSSDSKSESVAPIDEAILKVWESLKDLAGLKIELCGTWLWVSGETFPHKKAIKEAGCRWASKKKKWYWRAETETKKSRKEWDMKKIRDNFGSKVMSHNRVNKLAYA